MKRTQQQTVTINRGLYLVRYASAEDESRPPKVKVSPDPESQDVVSLLLHPDHDEAVLWQPDTCLAVRAMTQGKLAIEVIPLQEGASTAATVRIEPLLQGDATSPSIQSKKRKSMSHDLASFRILGHVAGIGDVSVNANEWLAGPSAPSRIEGISIHWPGKPEDLDIHYAIKTSKPQTNSGQTVGLGSFAGTRGKAMPVVGLMLELSGPAASMFQISVEAIFLGSPATRITGKRVVASGPTGREPLVGLRVVLEGVDAAARSNARHYASKPERKSGRVRVFRSRQSQDQLVSA
jgi:hypothetical protein